MNAIDIHTHVVPAQFPPYAGRHADARWPQMQETPDCRHRNVIIEGRNFRTVSEACWDVERRIEAMTQAGIARQVLSPMPELLSYWLADEDALAVGRHVNDTIAGMVARAPGRFVALGMVPLQNPELAARELERLMQGGVFRGVEIGTNVNGVPVGDPRFEPFFAAAEDLGAAVFVHALHPSVQSRLVGSPKLVNFVGLPCENAFAITSLMTSGMLERHPRLRLAFSHGGGVFALILPRLIQGCRIAPEVAEKIGRSPLEHARRLYYDTLVYDATTLRFLVDTFGVRQLCVGTDFPFDIQEKAPLVPVAALGYGEAEQRLLHAENALCFLGLEG
jgi:aminocarboxymuconate-semialdehyde decarboxylase